MKLPRSKRELMNNFGQRFLSNVFFSSQKFNTKWKKKSCLTGCQQGQMMTFVSWLPNFPSYDKRYIDWHQYRWNPLTLFGATDNGRLRYNRILRQSIKCSTLTCHNSVTFGPNGISSTDFVYLIFYLILWTIWKKLKKSFCVWGKSFGVTEVKRWPRGQ